MKILNNLNQNRKGIEVYYQYLYNMKYKECINEYHLVHQYSFYYNTVEFDHLILKK
jgi:hypothetical protein